MYTLLLQLFHNFQFATGVNKELYKVDVVNTITNDKLIPPYKTYSSTQAFTYFNNISKNPFHNLSSHNECKITLIRELHGMFGYGPVLTSNEICKIKSSLPSIDILAKSFDKIIEKANTNTNSTTNTTQL